MDKKWKGLVGADEYEPPEEKVYVSRREEYDIYSTTGQRIGTARGRPSAIVIEDEPQRRRAVGHTPLYGKYVSGVVIKFKRSEAP